MLNVSAALAAALHADGATPVWYVEIDKSEGTTDPDGGTARWPGTGEAHTRRIFTVSTVGWSTRSSLIAAGALHEDRLSAKGIGDIVRKLQSATREPGGLAGTDAVDIRIDNTDGGVAGNPAPTSRWFAPASGSTETLVRFEGRRGRVYLTEASLTNRLDSLLVFSFKINDVQPDGDSIVLVCESDIVAWDVDAPPNIFQNEELNDEGLLPRSTIGKPIPLVFGAHDMAPGYVTADVTDGGTTDTGRRVVFADVAQLPIKSISEMRFGDSGLVKATGGFASIKSAAVPNLSDVTTFTIDVAVGGAYFDEPDDEQILLFVDIQIISNAKHQGVQGTDPGKAVDRDEATYGQIAFSSVNASYNERLMYKIPAIGVGGEIEKNGDYTGIFVLHKSHVILTNNGLENAGADWGWCIGAYGDSIINYARPYLIAYWTLEGYANVDESVDFYSPPTPNADCQCICDFPGAWENFSSLALLSGKFFNIFGKNGLRNDGGTCDAKTYEFLLRVYFAVDTPDEGYFADVEGYEDRDALVTGVTDQLIEHPADIAVALLCYWTPAPYLDGLYMRYPFDGASQAAARSARSGWKFARALVDKTKFSDLVAGLGREALLWFYVDATGALAVAPWDASGTSAVTLTPAMLADGEVASPERSRLEEVVTEFEFRFKENTVRGEFDETLFCRAGASSVGLGAEYEALCAWASFDNGGVKRKETFDLSWIRDRATALEAAKRLIRYHTARRWGFTAPCDLDLVGLEIGDRVEFSPMEEWPRSYDPGMLAAKYRIYEIRKSPEKFTVTFKATEVFA